MKLVYVAGPFSAPTRAGVEKNIARAVALGVEVAKLGAFPVVPHANTAHPAYEKVQPYQFWIDGTLALVRVCHALALVDGWERSSGARGEAEEANRLGLPVFDPGVYQLREIAEWVKEPAIAETLRPEAPPAPEPVNLDCKHCGKRPSDHYSIVTLDPAALYCSKYSLSQYEPINPGPREPMPTLDESEVRG